VTTPALAALPALLLLLAPGAAPAQVAEVPAIAPAPQAAPSPGPRREATPRPRPRDARDRAWMDGGVPGGFAGFNTPQPTTPRPELAPRPNLDIEGPRTAQAPRLGETTIAPTLIHPRVPGRSAVQDGGASQTENRFLRDPAPGLRLSTPMAW